MGGGEGGAMAAENEYRRKKRKAYVGGEKKRGMKERTCIND